MTESGNAPVVAFQGERGAFSEEAVLAFFAAPETVAVPTFRDVFECVRDGRAAAGAVPMENAIAGTIRETHDLLFESWSSGIRIVGETTVPVELALLALPGQTIEDIKRVYSHVQALAQADAFLRARDWTVMSAYNTAGAARLIAESGERGAAAVASPRVAEIYGLEIVATGIQSDAANRTRFAVIARDALPPAWPLGTAVSGPPRTTVAFTVANVPGSLNRALDAFASRGLNLTRLESRPWVERGSTWEYVFWVDLDTDVEAPAAKDALADLGPVTTVLRILGSYPRSSTG